MAYSYDELVDRCKFMKEKAGIMFSVQYGMVFLLNDEGKIVLCLTDLLTEEGKQEARKRG